MFYGLEISKKKTKPTIQLSRNLDDKEHRLSDCSLSTLPTERDGLQRNWNFSGLCSFTRKPVERRNRPRAKYWCGLDMSPKEANLLGGYPSTPKRKITHTTRLQRALPSHGNLFDDEQTAFSRNHCALLVL